MNPSDVHIFSRVGRTGSFAAAAEQLGLTRSAVSKGVSRLEKHLGVILVARSTRSSSLTDAGRRFYKYAAEIDTVLEQAAVAVTGGDQEVVGNLSISMPTSLGAVMTPLLMKQFRHAWPKLTLHLQFDERYLDLIGGSIDVAIRVARRLEDSNLMSKRIGTTRKILVASPGYLAQYGTPKHIKELVDHRCLDLNSAARSQVIWRFRDSHGPVEIPIECTITANTNLPLILAACMDEGIMHTPELLVGGELALARLVEILPEFADSRQWGVYAVYPYSKAPAKVRVFIDFVAQALPALGQIDRWAPFGEPAAYEDAAITS